MKTFLSIWLSLCISFTLVQAEGIDFFHGTIEEAKTAAAEQGRLIFVDAYTTWCGPCKRMSKNVFTDAEVGEFYNANFVNLKLDMEKGEGLAFQRQYRVTAFPTLLFLDAEGNLVHRVVGGMDVSNFLKLGSFAAAKNSGLTSEMQRAYEDGNREPGFMLKYIRGLSRAGQPVLKVSNDYLNDQSDLTTETNLRIIYHSTVEADSRIFNLMVEHQKEITALFGEEKLMDQIEAAAGKTVEKAIKYRNADLMEEAIDKVDRYASSRSKTFGPKARLRYYGQLKDYDNYYKEARSYARQGEEARFELANHILRNMQEEKQLMQAAQDWMLKNCKSQPNEANFFTAAQLLFANGEEDQALDYAKQALEYSNNSKSGARPHIERLIKTLEDNHSR